MEVEETVKKLILSEKDARAIVDSAKDKAKKILSKANEEGESLLESKKLEAKRVSEEMIRKAEEEARAKSKEIIQKALNSVENLKNQYASIREDFTSEFVKKSLNLKV
ncbi:MAG: hypothetical protein ACP5F2_02425 [Athalassotoga sp.]|uniref:hypothetical protein n=1 Tax=Athalassotoga sp. TaxID=2022597 RepID=UPI003CFD7D80